jgi:hypothetical protein
MENEEKMPYVLPRSLAECFGAPESRCERALAQKAERARRTWCVEGVIDTRKIKVVYALSDLHGDAGFFMYWLLRAGLVVRDGRRWRWVSREAALVVCGDVSDDYRGGAASDDAALYAANFEGFEGAERGSGTWNVLAFISFLVAECGARIVVVIGNHELMNVQDAAGQYKRKVTSEVEARRGGWGVEGGMRALLGTPLVAACAGSLLFMHAEPPIFGDSDVGPESPEFGRGAAGAAAGFTRKVNKLARENLRHPLVELSLWGRSLGSELAARPRACDTLRLMFPGVTLVRGHCPNRPGAQGPTSGAFFGARAESAGAEDRLKAASGCTPQQGCKVYAARGPNDLDSSARGSYVGVVVSCASGSDFGGAVFRIDCMGSLAFDISARLCSVVAFDVRSGEAFCLVGTREAI